MNLPNPDSWASLIWSTSIGFTLSNPQQRESIPTKVHYFFGYLGFATPSVGLPKEAESKPVRG
jgi:hypothetical protein